jgi:hypothetical protein
MASLTVNYIKLYQELLDRGREDRIMLPFSDRPHSSLFRTNHQRRREPKAIGAAPVSLESLPTDAAGQKMIHLGFPFEKTCEPKIEEPNGANRQMNLLESNI